MHLRSVALGAVAALALTTAIGSRGAVADTLDIRKADNGVSLDAGES